MEIAGRVEVLVALGTHIVVVDMLPVRFAVKLPVAAVSTIAPITHSPTVLLVAMI